MNTIHAAKMELIKTFNGFKIRNGGKYYGGKKSGRVVWVTDYTYGRSYTEKTAQKIIAELVKGVNI